LWRHRKGKQQPWDADTLLAALENNDLIPRADPNTPSHMHRMARAEAFAQKVAMAPQLFDLIKCYTYYFRSIGMNDVDQFFAPQSVPQEAPLDPKVLAMQAKAQSDAQSNQVKLLDIQTRASEGAANRASKEHIEQLKIAERLAVHPQSQEIIADPTGGVTP
jgi:hypothetical protein